MGMDIKFVQIEAEMQLIYEGKQEDISDNVDLALWCAFLAMGVLYKTIV